MERGEPKALSAREYRLVPMGEETDPNRKDAVDLVALYRKLISRSGLIKKIVAVFLFFGILAALLSPNEYLSESVLMPELKSSSSEAGSLLQSYGGMFGLGEMSALSSGKEDVIPPQVYPMIVQSPAFQHSLLNEQLYFSDLDTTITGYEYFERHYSPSLHELIADYTIKLPSKIWGPQYPPGLPDRLAADFLEENVIQLSDQQLEIVEKMNNRIEVSLNIESGVLYASALMPDRAASAQLNRNMIAKLKRFVEEYSTQKAKEDLEFAEVQYEQAQEFFEEAQQNLASFLDQNLNLSSARVMAREQRLQAEFDIAYNRFQNVSDRLLEAKVNVQELTPVFKTIQEVNVPVSTHRPHRIFIVLIALISGLFTAFIVIAGIDIYGKVKDKL